MKKLFGKHLDLIEANQSIAVLEKDLEATTTNVISFAPTLRR
jgi:hypothetical protein